MFIDAESLRHRTGDRRQPRYVRVNAAPALYMLPRGRQRRRSHEDQTFQLSRFERCEGEDAEDIHPDSDAAFLHRHRLKDDLDEGDVIDDQDARKGVFERLLIFMSRSPLLVGLSSTKASPTYGALATENGSDDDICKRDRRKASSSAIGSVVSNQSPDARRRRRSYSGSGSRSRLHGRLRLRASSPMLIAEPGHAGGQSGHIGGGLPFDLDEAEEEGRDGEETISIDDNDDSDPIDNSPYPQVRASVAATDNVLASINTPRMWTLSLLCAFLGSATNLFFSLRFPSVAITPVIALVVVHPLGRAWDALLKSEGDPPIKFQYGLRVQQPRDGNLSQHWTRRLRLWLAQGEWNEKEHACVYISSNVAFGFAFATDVIVEQHKFYKQDVSIIYQVLLTISTQILGYSFAGLTRRYLVRPPSMIWPGILMASAMFTTIHSSENHFANGWKVTRWKFFLTVFYAAFAWYFLPGLLMPALSYFSIVTWFAPNNVVIANLVGCACV